MEIILVKSPEKEILVNILESIDNSDKWIASIVESYIYHNHTKLEDDELQKYIKDHEDIGYNFKF